MLRSINVKALIAIIVIALTGSFTLNAQSVDEILKSHFKAVGNEKFEKIESYTSTGSLSIMGNSAPMNIFFKKPDKIRTEISVMGMDIVSVYNGKVGYVSVPGQPLKELTAKELKDMTGSNGLEDRLAQAKKDKAKITFVGKIKLDSIDVLKLKIVDEAGDSSFAYIDPTNWYIVKMESNKTVQGQSAQIEENFSDFKTVDGITFAYSINTSAMGQQASVKFEKVTFNAPIDDKQFEKPVQ